MVGMGRFELPTSPTRKERSTKLSHIPTTVKNCKFGCQVTKTSWWVQRKCFRSQVLDAHR